MRCLHSRAPRPWAWRPRTAMTRASATPSTAIPYSATQVDGPVHQNAGRPGDQALELSATMRYDDYKNIDKRPERQTEFPLPADAQLCWYAAR